MPLRRRSPSGCSVDYAERAIRLQRSNELGGHSQPERPRQGVCGGRGHALGLRRPGETGGCASDQVDRSGRAEQVLSEVKEPS